MDWAARGPPGVPDGRPRVRRRPPRREGDPVGSGPRPARCSPGGGQGGAQVPHPPRPDGDLGARARAHAPRPRRRAFVPRAARPRRRPAAPRPSLSPTPSPCQVDAVDWGGFSALHYAARRNSRECIEALLAKGADRRLVALGRAADRHGRRGRREEAAPRRRPGPSGGALERQLDRRGRPPHPRREALRRRRRRQVGGPGRSSSPPPPSPTPRRRRPSRRRWATRCR